MNTETTRVPFEESYVCLLGQAVYLFAYYEWQIIYIINCLSQGFVREYSRGNPLTSRGVHKRFAAELAKGNAPSGASLASLEACRDTFDNLIPRRNALVNAHPITDKVEGQIVAFQAGPVKPIRDLKWERAHLRAFIQDVDKAACEAGALFDRLR